MKNVLKGSRALLVGGALLTGALTVTAAGTATAAPQSSGDSAVSSSRGVAGAPAPSATVATYTVNVWARVNHRTGPHTSSSLIGTLGTGDNPHQAQCWIYGDTVTAEGYTNNIWIKAYNKAAKKWGYSSAIYFKGDKRANLPYSAKC
ncbi:SH3 domain-containing protein [Streptomyces oryzae]|uniref:SH3 domain-containing protein n=1 Tax=Streptomyces oryzae TaxID=1434886 RepID=A0ABS3XCB7_9ACTN|nr:SH3 domain-containing protein [Streptomyces oryzae]MBO8193015.1 SH3 domain-containing protein [Streptomyces oryzae]